VAARATQFDDQGANDPHFIIQRFKLFRVPSEGVEEDHSVEIGTDMNVKARCAHGRLFGFRNHSNHYFTFNEEGYELSILIDDNLDLDTLFRYI